MTNIPFTTPNLAGSSTEAFTQFDFLLSDSPVFFTEDFEVAASQNLTVYQVVGLDVSGRIIPAVLGTTAAIGITTAPIVTGAGQNPKLQIIRGGHFNGDMLAWHSTYNTDAKKIAAFRGAATPTNIVVAFNKYNRAS